MLRPQVSDDSCNKQNNHFLESSTQALSCRTQIPRIVGIPSDIPLSVHCPPITCYDYQYPGLQVYGQIGERKLAISLSGFMDEFSSGLKPGLQMTSDYRTSNNMQRQLKSHVNLL